MPNNFSHSQPKVLLIDDEAEMLKIMAAPLAEKGFKIQATENSLDALNLAINNHFDLIITDIKMPEMDGITLIRNLRKSPKKHTPIVISSAQLSKDKISELVKLKVSKVYIKPLNPLEFANGICHLLGYEGKAKEQLNPAEKQKKDAEYNAMEFTDDEI